jgi:pilus assembly protein CpaB
VTLRRHGAPSVGRLPRGGDRVYPAHVNKRALFIALVFAILGIILLVLYQQRFVAEASGGEKIKLLIAVKPIEHGKVITEEMLAIREVPMAYVEDRAVKEVEKAKILGLRVGDTVQAQQTIMWTDLVTANEDRRDLSSLVQPGSRAVSVMMAREGSSVALIRPGDYVDVLGVMNQQGGESQKVAVVLLQRVLVLATGLETSPDAVDQRDNKNRNSDTASLLTLSLPVPEAQLLALAIEKGKLAVVLRNPEDQRTAASIPDLKSEILFDAPKRTQGGMPHAGGPVDLQGGNRQ